MRGKKEQEKSRASKALDFSCSWVLWEGEDPLSHYVTAPPAIFSKFWGRVFCVTKICPRYCRGKCQRQLTKGVFLYALFYSIPITTVQKSWIATLTLAMTIIYKVGTRLKPLWDDCCRNLWDSDWRRLWELLEGLEVLKVLRYAVWQLRLCINQDAPLW